MIITALIDNYSNEQSDKLLVRFVDPLYWVLLIMYTNPGDFFEAFKIWYIVGRFNIKDLLFVLLSFCYVIVPKEYDIYDDDFKKIRNYLFFFLIYYFFVFCYLIPQLNNAYNYSLQIALLKSRWILYNVFLFVYLFTFIKRRWDIFVKLFLFSGIIILILFIQAAVTKINILPVTLVNRVFVNINRHMMLQEGLLPLLIPLGVTVLVFNLKFKYKHLFLTGFALMSLYYLISITRRDIIGIFIYFILAIIIYSIITGSYRGLLNRVVKSTFVIILVTIGIYFIFPKYIDAGRMAMVQSLNVIEKGETTGGHKDERLGLRPFIFIQFINHPLLGTGFDNRWRTGEGDAQGYEASDYPFLASLAMFGIFGVSAFLPVYIILIKVLKKDFKHLKTRPWTGNEFLFSVFFAFILFFTFNFLQYFNYFGAISISNNIMWYFSLALYLGFRSNLYRFE